MKLAEIVDIEEALNKLGELSKSYSRPVTIALFGHSNSGKSYLCGLVKRYGAVYTTRLDLANKDAASRAEYIIFEQVSPPLSKEDLAVSRGRIESRTYNQLNKGIDLTVLINNPNQRDLTIDNEVREIYDLIILNPR